MDNMQMATMFSALCLMCMPGVLADDCAPYIGADLKVHKPQTCVLSFCSGTCTERYCSFLPPLALDQTQFLCIVTHLYVIIGVSVVLAVILIGGIISCFCKSLFLCCRASPSYMI
ncbi:protein shisa-4-like [Pseudophryne corroboree]|uniref:protein shisa-4-like n=1 Tax=Pseudophryne corroboree TaxID=495146 RepID=UPI003081E3B6